MKRTVLFFYLYDKVKDVNIKEENTVPVFTPFIENKRNIDKSTLYSFKDLFNCFMLTLPIYVFFRNRQSTQNIVCCLLICLLKKFTPVQ